MRFPKNDTLNLALNGRVLRSLSNFNYFSTKILLIKIQISSESDLVFDIVSHFWKLVSNSVFLFFPVYILIWNSFHLRYTELRRFRELFTFKHTTTEFRRFIFWLSSYQVSSFDGTTVCTTNI